MSPLVCIDCGAADRVVMIILADDTRLCRRCLRARRARKSRSIDRWIAKVLAREAAVAGSDASTRAHVAIAAPEATR